MTTDEGGIRYYCTPGDHVWDGVGRVKVAMPGYSFAPTHAWACPDHDPDSQGTVNLDSQFGRGLDDVIRDVMLAKAALLDEREGDLRNVLDLLLQRVTQLHAEVRDW